jgi:hypothetical protein
VIDLAIYLVIEILSSTILQPLFTLLSIAMAILTAAAALGYLPAQRRATPTSVTGNPHRERPCYAARRRAIGSRIGRPEY